METHLRLIGYLNIALGILGLVAVVITLILFKGPSGVLLINARVGGSTTTSEGFAVACILFFLFVMAGPLIAVGYGLLQYQEWARDMGMILAIVTLVHIPFGTFLGIYSLWVLTSFEVEPLFKVPPQARKIDS
jgi:hypothetical protein